MQFCVFPLGGDLPSHVAALWQAGVQHSAGGLSFKHCSELAQWVWKVATWNEGWGVFRGRSFSWKIPLLFFLLKKKPPSMMDLLVRLFEFVRCAWLSSRVDQVTELATVKRPQERAFALQQWQETGGIMIIGYEMYRNLTQGRNIKSKKLKETFQKTLVNPGTAQVVQWLLLNCIETWNQCYNIKFEFTFIWLK